jgi:hypothetical protein
LVLGKEQRVLRARLAAHSLHAQGKTNTAPGTAAFLTKFELSVDPDGLLDPAERSKRAAHARTAYFIGLALKSSQKRSGGSRRRRGISAERSPETVTDPGSRLGERRQ